MRWLRAILSLWKLSLRRLTLSTNTLMVALPMLGAALFVLRRNFDDEMDPEKAFDSFSEFLLVVYASFLIPICAVAYGASSIGGEREDRTLVFLLMRPLPRPLILLGKFAASWPLTLVLTLGSFWIYCRLAGKAGEIGFAAYSLPAVLMTTAYVCLFQFFSVCFRHATILALVYALFMELLIGNMPGIIKRVAINYYGRCLMYSAGQQHGLKSPNERWFELLDPTTASWALIAISLVLLVATALVFHLREYRDLT